MEIDQQQNYEYIAQFWEVIAACVWQEYQTHGRGALLVGAFAEPDDPIYLPLEIIQGHPLTKELAMFVEEYDPNNEVVVIFLRRPDSVNAFKGAIPERGTPPQLYERLKAVLRQN